MIRLDEAVFDVVAVMSDAYGIAISVDCEAVEIEADRIDLRRVLVNIVRNAYQAAGEQGVIEISLRVEGSTAILEVEDSGPGFEPDQVHAHLGLHIVQDLVARAGGRVELKRSRLGGAMIRVALRGHRVDALPTARAVAMHIAKESA